MKNWMNANNSLWIRQMNSREHHSPYKGLILFIDNIILILKTLWTNHPTNEALPQNWSIHSGNWEEYKRGKIFGNNLINNWMFILGHNNNRGRTSNNRSIWQKLIKFCKHYFCEGIDENIQIDDEEEPPIPVERNFIVSVSELNI